MRPGAFFPGVPAGFPPCGSVHGTFLWDWSEGLWEFPADGPPSRVGGLEDSPPPSPSVGGFAGISRGMATPQVGGLAGISRGIFFIEVYFSSLCCICCAQHPSLSSVLRGLLFCCRTFYFDVIIFLN